MQCPCDSKKAYSNCCQPYHLADDYPVSAETLMRARYCAYVLELEDFILNTWSKSTRPGTFAFEKGLKWDRLRIVKTQKGHAQDIVGKVSFKAFYQMGEDKGVMRETSQFERDENHHWVYVTGDVR